MKFEFGDLYKFTVSLGVVIITLAVLGPWLFLKEPFDLFKTEAEIKAVTDIAKAAILKRQATVSFILDYIPWFSFIGTIVGAIFIYMGLSKWYKNQLLIDEQTKLELKIKEQSLRDATKDEIEEKGEREYESQKTADISNDESDCIISFKGQYSNVEKLVYTKMSDIYNKKYHVSHNKMVAGVELDILLKGKGLLTKDLIIEVKYIRKGFNFGWLREAYLKNLYAKSVYSQLLNRLPNTLLLIVMDSDAYDDNKYRRLLKRLNEEPNGRKGKDLVRIITKQNLMETDEYTLQDELGIYA